MHMLSRVYGPPKATYQAVPNSDRSVDAIIAELKAVLDGGPKTKYLGVLGTGSQEALNFYFGPYAPALKLAAGSMTQVGFAHNLNLEVFETIPWTVEGQLAGIAEAYPAKKVALSVDPRHHNVVTIRDGETKLLTNVLKPMQEIVVDQGNPSVPWVADSPAVLLNWDDAFGLETAFFSASRQRVVKNISGPLELLIEANMCANPKGVLSNAPITGNLTLDGLNYADVSLLVDTRRLFKADTALDVYHMRRGRFSVAKVRLDTLLSLKGDWYARPAFSEYYRPTLRELAVENPRFEGWLMQKLQIPVKDQEESRLAVRISFNYYRIKELLGASFGRDINLSEYVSTIVVGRVMAPDVVGE